MNREILVVISKKEEPTATEKILSCQLYYNTVMNFLGTKDEAVKFAKKHNFGGGVDVYDRKSKTYTHLTI